MVTSTKTVAQEYIEVTFVKEASPYSSRFNHCQSLIIEDYVKVTSAKVIHQDSIDRRTQPIIQKIQELNKDLINLKTNKDL